MHVGGFNAGLIGVSPHPESQSFLQWWRDRLRLPGHAAIEWGYDQAWLDLVPILFPSLGILRDAGYNVAYWNLSDRPLRQEQTGVLYAGDAPLTLFHFSMFNVRAPADQREVTRRSDVEITPLVAEIVRAYAKRLEAANASSCRTMGYGYSVFSNGSPITARQRSCFAAQAVESAFLDEDPFDVRVALKRLKGLDRLRVASPFVARLVRSIRERAASIIGPGDI
jgi:hypothetical protein